jgi:hypothetical protein
MTLKSAGRQRQHRHQTIKRLDRRLLVDAEHCSVRRRVQIKANHVGRLGFEVRIVRGHVALKPMGLQTVFSPDARDHHVRDSQRALASLRLLQWTEPSLGGFCVHASTRPSIWAVPAAGSLPR